MGDGPRQLWRGSSAEINREKAERGRRRDCARRPFLCQSPVPTGTPMYWPAKVPTALGETYSLIYVAGTQANQSCLPPRFRVREAHRLAFTI